MAVVTGSAWLGLRFLAARREPATADPSAPGAAVATILVLAVSVLALWLANPFAALLMTPALHLWMLATLVEPGPPRRARLVMVAAGLLLPVLLAIYVLVSLSLDPLSGAWYLMLLVTGGHVGVANHAGVGGAGRRAGSVIAIVRSGRPERRSRVRPPRSAGPLPTRGRAPGRHRLRHRALAGEANIRPMGCTTHRGRP